MKTVWIAAKDAPQRIKEASDFVCVEGVPDQITFAKALAALDDGGRLIPYGTFDLSRKEEE